MALELERVWNERVIANREQVERYRRVPEEADFYAPVTTRFVDDPRREGDAVLDALLDLARPDDAWLDIGAGAGRYALPLALRVRRVVALDPSPGMLAALRDGMALHGIGNVDPREGRWPVEGERADVALIAHVGYDVEPIGPFLDAMEAAADRCVAILREPWPASVAAPFWPIIHGVERVPLPGCADMLALLRARGARPRLRKLAEPPRRFEDEETLVAQLRHQLWIADQGADNERLQDEVRAVLVRDRGGVGVPGAPAWIGVVEWRSRYDPALEGE